MKISSLEHLSLSLHATASVPSVRVALKIGLHPSASIPCSTSRAARISTEFARSSVLFGPGKPVFRGAPLTITRHFLERFLRAVHFVSQYNEALFVTFFISCLFFYKTSYDLSMGGGGIMFRSWRTINNNTYCALEQFSHYSEGLEFSHHLANN